MFVTITLPAPLFLPVRPCRTRQVLTCGTLAVRCHLGNISVSAERSSRYSCSPEAITCRRFAQAVPRVIHAVQPLSGVSCASFDAHHPSRSMLVLRLHTGDSVGSRHPRLRCGGGTGGTSASTTYQVCDDVLTDCSAAVVSADLRVSPGCWCCR